MSATFTAAGLSAFVASLKHSPRPYLEAGMRASAEAAAAQAKILAPVDTGRLRASITGAAQWRGVVELVGVVGSNVQYAPYVEYGTGTLAEGEGGKGGAHFPPPAALDRWARRHHMPSGFVVARAIARRGGLRPRPFLRPAVETPFMRRVFQEQMSNAMKRWARSAGVKS